MKKEEPGKYPFSRGIYRNMYNERLWTMRQYAGFQSTLASNKRYNYLIENGVNGLSVAFDLPTQIGYDSDHYMAEGEVGKVGVPVSKLSDMESLFKNIQLDKISVSMTINSTAAILIAMYIAIAEKQKIPFNKLRGTIQNDILKEYIARGTYIYPPNESIRLVTDIFEFCTQKIPNWNIISISGYHIREAGSDAVQELAFTFSNGIEYIKAAIDKGLDPNNFGQKLSFFFNSHNGFLEEISKFRAARRIWAKIMKDRFGVTNKKALMCRFHTQTGGSTLTSNEIDNNIIRTTIQSLAAVIGGTQSLHTNSKDEALSLPTNSSAKLALRTQQIIAHETNILKYPDPFGGSYIIEELTNDLEKNTFELIKKIDELGGSISAIEQNFIQDQISKSAYKYQKDIDEKKIKIIGVNTFNQKNIDIEPQTLLIDEKNVQEQIKSLRTFKKNRNNIQVKIKLNDLKKTAESDENLMPSIISCIKNDCTLGEISNIFRKVFGEYTS
tara:strand:- start:767 stop:2260 length:1494 start_codon:yes stop_codon:yes gene_type:complete